MSDRRIEYQAIAELVPARRNPKHHDIAGIRASIDRFGFVEPIVLDERTGRLISGHGRLETLVDAEAAGIDPPDGIKLGDDGRWQAPIVRGWSSRSDSEADALLVGVNHLVERGGWDARGLFEILDDLRNDLGGDGLAGTGYVPQDVEELLASLQPEPEPPGGYSAQQRQEYAERYSVDELVERAAQHYERVGFPYPSTPLHERMWLIERLARVEFRDLAGTPLAHGVADEWHPHRWAVKVEGKSGAPLDAFSNAKMLRQAIKLAIEMNGNLTDVSLRNMLGFVRGHQAAANFRPGFMLRCIREFCPAGGTVLDTSTGFGGRIVGFAASTAGRYVGIDPSTRTDEGNRQMAEDLGIADRVTLIREPAEDVSPDDLPECDLAVTSPPYFGKERYAEEATQSWVRYTTGEDWRDGFLVPMLALQFKALRSGAVSIINIADVKMKGKPVPLVDWTVEAAQHVGFEREATSLVYALGRVPGQGEAQDRYEPVLMFRRP